MAKYKFSLGIGLSNAYQEEIIDIPDEDLLACRNEDEKQELLDNWWKDWSSNYIDGGVVEV